MTLQQFIDALTALPVQQQSYYLYRRTAGGNFAAVVRWTQYDQSGMTPPSSTVLHTTGGRGYLSPAQLVARLTPTLPRFGTGSVYVDVLGGYAEVTGFDAFGAGHVTDNPSIILDVRGRVNGLVIIKPTPAVVPSPVIDP